MEMRKKLKGLFWTIEINLVIWLIVLGRIIETNIDSITRGFVIAGFSLAAILQHLAYYNIYKAQKKEQDVDV